jgi:CheY-like chemotaxis protein
MANILIVEDNESLQLAYSSFLKEEGHKVTTASRVKEALKYLSKNTPDLILLDMLMPEKPGLDLLKEYDVLHKHPTVKVIAFSNLTEPRIQEEALALGVSSHITKSLTTPKELVDQIDAALKMGNQK